MFCTKCGSSNDDSARFCEKCGAALAAPAPAGWQPAPQAAAAVAADPRMRGGAQYQPAQSGGYAVGKTPIVALLLSFLLPGVGQFYNGDAKKGGIMLGGFFLSVILTAAVIGIVGVVGIWIWSMVDAYRVASGAAPLSS